MTFPSVYNLDNTKAITSGNTHYISSKINLLAQTGDHKNHEIATLISDLALFNEHRRGSGPFRLSKHVLNSFQKHSEFFLKAFQRIGNTSCSMPIEICLIRAFYDHGLLDLAEALNDINHTMHETEEIYWGGHTKLTYLDLIHLAEMNFEKSLNLLLNEFSNKHRPDSFTKLQIAVYELFRGNEGKLFEDIKHSIGLSSGDSYKIQESLQQTWTAICELYSHSVNYRNKPLIVRVKSALPLLGKIMGEYASEQTLTYMQATNEKLNEVMTSGSSFRHGKLKKDLSLDF